VIIARENVEAFIAEHGGIHIFGETEEGPIYTLADGWLLFIPVGGETAQAAPPEERGQ
jgi:hypothetical protein